MTKKLTLQEKYNLLADPMWEERIRNDGPETALEFRRMGLMVTKTAIEAVPERDVVLIHLGDDMSPRWRTHTEVTVEGRYLIETSSTEPYIEVIFGDDIGYLTEDYEDGTKFFGPIPECR